MNTGPQFKAKMSKYCKNIFQTSKSALWQSASRGIAANLAQISTEHNKLRKSFFLTFGS
jgi:hypothetical protein